MIKSSARSRPTPLGCLGLDQAGLATDRDSMTPTSGREGAWAADTDVSCRLQRSGCHDSVPRTDLAARGVLRQTTCMTPLGPPDDAPSRATGRLTNRRYPTACARPLPAVVLRSLAGVTSQTASSCRAPRDPVAQLRWDRLRLLDAWHCNPRRSDRRPRALCAGLGLPVDRPARASRVHVLLG